MTKFRKYPSISRIGHEESSGIMQMGTITVLEKVDGSNIRFMRECHLDEKYHTEDRDIVFGSRNIAYKNEKDTDSGFEEYISFVRETVAVEDIIEMEDTYNEPLVFYGEIMRPHTIEYAWDEVPDVFGIDIRSAETGERLMWGDVSSIFDHIGLETPAVVYRGHVSNIPDSLDPRTDDGVEMPESEYGAPEPEGVVIRNDETDQIAKVHSETFREVHKEQFSPDEEDTYEPSDSVALARRFTTRQRVLKRIHRMEEEGGGVGGMGVMEGLWKDVFEDVIEEEFETIFLGNYTIDTKEFRSEVASITADVLQAYLERPDGSVLNELQTSHSEE